MSLLRVFTGSMAVDPHTEVAGRLPMNAVADLPGGFAKDRHPPSSGRLEVSSVIDHILAVSAGLPVHAPAGVSVGRKGASDICRIAPAAGITSNGMVGYARGDTIQGTPRAAGVPGVNDAIVVSSLQKQRG